VVPSGAPSAWSKNTCAPGGTELTATARVVGVEVKVVVADDGVGMDAATRARVFEPLFTTKKDGTGLGLAIVESLVKQHGGALTLESEKGQGARFTVSLPAR
jgi:signal transduction histidine kinase